MLVSNDVVAKTVAGIAKDEETMRALAKMNGHTIPEGVQPMLDPVMIMLIIDLVLKIIAMLWGNDDE